MNYVVWSLCFLVWSAIGIASLIWHWTEHMDLAGADLIFVSVAGCVIGPFAFISFIVLPLLGRHVLKGGWKKRLTIPARHPWRSDVD